MSDTESHTSYSPRNSGQRINDEKFDQRLDDHRHQPASLPVPLPSPGQSGSGFASSSAAVGTGAGATGSGSASHADGPGSGAAVSGSGSLGSAPRTYSREDHLNPISILESPTNKVKRSVRSQSFSEGGLDPKDQRHLSVSGGISFKNPNLGSSIKKKRRDTRTDNLEADLASPMTRFRTNDTSHSDRRPSSSSIDSEANSHGSRSSQETEEDVCFPMLREHVRVNGIDFDEIDEFINEERDNAKAILEQQQVINEKLKLNSEAPKSVSSSQLRHQSGASLKYTPKNILKKTTTILKKNKEGANDDSSITPIRESDNQQGASDSSIEYEKGSFPNSTQSDDFVHFSGARINEAPVDPLPERFSFFSSQLEETIHAPDIPSLTEKDQSVKEVFNSGEGTWWLDCTCPTDAEMKVLSKAFGLHPLTSEDIRVQESREKVELFKNYYFVCFHTFEQDKESEDYLEPINVYIVVFREGILTFHFSPTNHSANVRRRVRQLRDYVDVSADWICYAIIDDITDAFIPVITGVEYEADAIEDSVFVSRETDFGTMLLRIGESRRKVMTLMRLLSGKADVIKMFAKRCQDEVYLMPNQPSQPNLTTLSPNDTGTPLQQSPPPVMGFGHDGTGGISFGPRPGAPPNMVAPNQYQFHHAGNITQPRADIALYLGDIQDHVVTMFQNLLAYEKIFSRSHANYLAQLQVESVNSNNKVTVMLSQVTLLGTLLLPLNLVTGLFGMNVVVPGQNAGGLGWFFGILGVMVIIVTSFFIMARIWLARLLNPEQQEAQVSGRRSIRSFGLRRNRDAPAKSIASFPNYA